MLDHLELQEAGCKNQGSSISLIKITLRTRQEGRQQQGCVSTASHSGDHFCGNAQNMQIHQERKWISGCQGQLALRSENHGVHVLFRGKIKLL